MKIKEKLLHETRSVSTKECTGTMLMPTIIRYYGVMKVECLNPLRRKGNLPLWCFWSIPASYWLIKVFVKWKCHAIRFPSPLSFLYRLMVSQIAVRCPFYIWFHVWELFSDVSVLYNAVTRAFKLQYDESEVVTLVFWFTVQGIHEHI